MIDELVREGARRTLAEALQARAQPAIQNPKEQRIIFAKWLE